MIIGNFTSDLAEPATRPRASISCPRRAASRVLRAPYLLFDFPIPTPFVSAFFHGEAHAADQLVDAVRVCWAGGQGGWKDAAGEGRGEGVAGKAACSLPTAHSLPPAAQLTGQALTIQTSDMGNIEIKLSQNSNLTKDTQYIEVVGKVDEHGESVREFTCVNLGDSLGKCEWRAKCEHRMLSSPPWHRQIWAWWNSAFSCSPAFPLSSPTPRARRIRVTDCTIH